MSLRTLLIHSADIERVTETRDAAGFASQTWATTATGVPCRFEPVPVAAAVEYGRLGLRVTHNVYLDTDQSLSVGSRLAFQGERYEVRQVTPSYRTDPTTPYVWEVLVERKATGA